MRTLLLTAIGDDRPGLVSSLAALVDDHGGNWVDARLALLAGAFAGIVRVDVPEERAEGLLAALPSLAPAVGLSVTARTTTAVPGTPGAATAPPDGPPWRLHLLGQDRTGMVREVAEALTTHGVTIEELSSSTREAPQGGGMLFEAEAAVRPAPGTDEAGVRAALEAIAAELMVDIDLDGALPDEA